MASVGGRIARTTQRNFSATSWWIAAVAGVWLVLLAIGIVYAIPNLDHLTSIVLAAALVLAASGLFVFGVMRALRRPSQPVVRTYGSRLRQLAEMSTGGVLICNGERIVAVNAVMRGMIPSNGPIEGGLLDRALAGWTIDRIPRGAEVEAVMETPCGPVAVRLSKRTIMHRDQPHTVVTVSDQRIRLQHEAELRRLQDTDPLTDLVNRTRFHAALVERFEAPGNDDSGLAPFTLVVIGLDRFKAYNDSLGPAAGDELLKRTATRLLAVPTGARIVGRLGGDQFGLLLDDGDPARVQALGVTLIDVLTRWLKTDGMAPNIGVSVGFATAPSDAASAEALATAAEMALRRAKADGKGVCRPYETGLAELAQAKHRLELALRRAIAEGQLEVHFQPQTNLRMGTYDGAEALLRWRHPERGFVDPSEFLPIAEETGLINEIGEWVLRTACTMAANWPDHLRVAVNLSALQFRRPDLAARFGRVLTETGFAPQRLELEVTESVLLQDEQRTLDTLNDFRALGIRIALDDFGTGYSSLSYLRKFPFDKIKLDKSYVRRAPEDEIDAAIVTAILTLAKTLGMSTTAEGVETEEQRVFVTAMGCTQGQGYLIGRAMPNANLPESFRRRLPNSAAIA